MRKKLFLLLGLIVCVGIQTNAQELVIESFELLQNDTYAQKNKRRDINGRVCAAVRISVPNAKDITFEKNEIMGDPVYGSGEVIVYMAQGKKFFTIHSNDFGTKRITFAEINSDIPKLEDRTYRLNLKVILPEDQQRRTLLIANVGYHPAQMSYGVMVGMAAKHGAYVHAITDFGSATTSLQCDDTGMLLPDNKNMPYYKEGVSHVARFSFTGGYLCRFWRFLYGYVGAGYGYRTLAWETVDSELVENVNHSFSGVAAEAGLIGNFNRFTISVGCHALDFKYPELNVGIGYFF